MSKHAFTNREVAQRLRDVADLMRLRGENRFRVAALNKAAASVAALEAGIGDAADRGALESIEGIGPGIAREIESLFARGRMDAYAALSRELPAGLLDILRLPNVGPKKAMALWQALGVTSLADLQRALQAGAVQGLKGFSRKSEASLAAGLEAALQRPPPEEPIGQALPAVERWMQALRAQRDPNVERVALTGELRQWRATVTAAQVLVQTADPVAAAAAIRELPMVARVDSATDAACRVALHSGLGLRVFFCPAATWGWRWARTTGDAEFWAALAAHARTQGFVAGDAGWRAVTAAAPENGPSLATEEEVFARIGLPYVIPELRTRQGLPLWPAPPAAPELMTWACLQGELHAHSTYSDGRNSLAAMAQAAMARGYRYWGVTDHGLGHGFGDSLDAERLLAQAAEIARLNRQYARAGQDFTLLAGVEAEITADGALGLPDDALARLDVVVASMHSALRQDAPTITARCLKAIANPHVDILGHPTGRLVGQRAPSALDVPVILQACAETGTAVEINCNPARLDLNDEYARQAAAMGCLLVMNCDAHGVTDLEVMRYGIGLARRAGLAPGQVLNTRSLPEVQAFLQR